MRSLRALCIASLIAWVATAGLVLVNPVATQPAAQLPPAKDDQVEMQRLRALAANLQAKINAAQAPAKRGRGHKALPLEVRKAQREADAKRHGDKIRKLPRVAAAAFDCRTMGWVGPVTDQAQCGSCWDFSGSEVCEDALFKAGVVKNDGTFTLSRQFTLDCYSNGGCNGDDNTTVLDRCKATGLPATATYGQYTSSPTRCNPTPGPLYKITDWGFVDNQGNGVSTTADIQAAMVQYGPIGCAVDASAFDNYQPGTILDGTGHNIDHDVLIVAWRTEATSGRIVWTVQNSWGTSYGNAGFLDMYAGAWDIGTEAVYAYATGPTPPTPPVPPSPPPVPPAPPVPPPAPPVPGPFTAPFFFLPGPLPLVAYPDQASATTAAQAYANAKQLPVNVIDSKDALVATLQPASPAGPVGTVVIAIPPGNPVTYELLPAGTTARLRDLLRFIDAPRSVPVPCCGQPPMK